MPDAALGSPGAVDQTSTEQGIRERIRSLMTRQDEQRDLAKQSLAEQAGLTHEIAGYATPAQTQAVLASLRARLATDTSQIETDSQYRAVYAPPHYQPLPEFQATALTSVQKPEMNEGAMFLAGLLGVVAPKHAGAFGAAALKGALIKNQKDNEVAQRRFQQEFEINRTRYESDIRRADAANQQAQEQARYSYELSAQDLARKMSSAVSRAKSAELGQEETEYRRLGEAERGKAQAEAKLEGAKMKYQGAEREATRTEGDISRLTYEADTLAQRKEAARQAEIDRKSARDISREGHEATVTASLAAQGLAPIFKDGRMVGTKPLAPGQQSPKLRESIRNIQSQIGARDITNQLHQRQIAEINERIGEIGARTEHVKKLTGRTDPEFSRLGQIASQAAKSLSDFQNRHPLSERSMSPDLQRQWLQFKQQSDEAWNKFKSKQAQMESSRITPAGAKGFKPPKGSRIIPFEDFLKGAQ